MRKALLLDRDGIINEEINYLHRVEDFVFVDGIFEVCRAFAERGYLLIVVTNQAGIGRGYYSEEDFSKLTAWMVAQFEERGVVIDGVFHCPYHPTEGIGAYRRESQDRKPGPGMILKARDAFDLDLASCVVVGDKMSDIEAGLNAGVGTNVLVGRVDPDADRKPDHVIASVRDLLGFVAGPDNSGKTG